MIEDGAIYFYFFISFFMPIIVSEFQHSMKISGYGI